MRCTLATSTKYDRIVKLFLWFASSHKIFEKYMMAHFKIKLN